MHNDAPPRSSTAWRQGRFALLCVTAWVFPRRRAQQSSALNAGFAGGCSPHSAAGKNMSFTGSWTKSVPEVPGSRRGAWRATVEYASSLVRHDCSESPTSFSIWICSFFWLSWTIWAVSADRDSARAVSRVSCFEISVASSWVRSATRASTCAARRSRPHRMNPDRPVRSRPPPRIVHDCHVRCREMKLVVG